MKELKKATHKTFKEFYEGNNGSRHVTCILDENCVRYTVSINGKIKSRREFDNNNKKLCFEKATKALNK